jgi:hypothetical protein
MVLEIVDSDSYLIFCVSKNQVSTLYENLSIPVTCKVTFHISLVNSIIRVIRVIRLIRSIRLLGLLGLSGLFGQFEREGN